MNPSPLSRCAAVTDRTGRRPRFLLAVFALIACLGAPARADEFEQGRAAFLANQLEEARALLQKAAGKPNANADTYAWLAETYRRLEQQDAADAMARRALALVPCHAMAHDVISSNANPQFGDWPGANAETSWVHAKLAVRCDSTDGNGWLSVWAGAVRYGDRALEQATYRRLLAEGFFGAPTVAYARWLLRDLPERALLLVNGDADTYPTLALQQVEGLRPDVAVMNLSLLEEPWYRRHLRDRQQVPMPFAPAELDQITDTFDDDGKWVGAGRTLDREWRKQLVAGRLGRPYVYSLTVNMDQLPDTSRAVVLAGAYLLAEAGPGGERTDTTAIRRSLLALRPDDFKGDWVGARDRSPVRIAGTRGMMMNLFYAAMLCAGAYDDRAPAFAMLTWASRFAQEVDAPPDQKAAILGVLQAFNRKPSR